mmetsp:Transcript_3611/g.8207  ORF Transcript_3611/g.8207 Transcript_3611/m.8207 type:complete len:140 (-) Transcript_3611:130-549(-)
MALDCESNIKPSKNTCSGIFRGNDIDGDDTRKLGALKKKFGGSVRNKAERLKKWNPSNQVLRRSSSQSTADSTCQSSLAGYSAASSAVSVESEFVAMMPLAVKMQPIGSTRSLDSHKRVVRHNNSNLPSRRRRPTVAEF